MQISDYSVPPDRLLCMGPGEIPGEDDDGLELPVNPDQGIPLIPDDDDQPVAPA